MRKIVYIFIISTFNFGNFRAIKVAENFTKPVFVQGFPGNIAEMMVVEQDGILKKLNLKNGKSELFLDLTDRVHHPRLPGDERGLLGFTFSPDYEISKSFYVNYVNKENETIISRFNFRSNNVKLIDSENILLKFKQPFSNHNGGMLAFGPNDGYLYIAVGDGGDAGDPYGNAQNIET